MKKILVPTDFSPNADKALNFAVQIAKKAKAKIILIHACELHDHMLIKEAKEKLSLRCESIRKEEKVTIQPKLYEGLVTDTILKAVKLHSPDLIVMGTLGDAAAKDILFGSKTAGIIGKTNVPVLAVPLLSEWADLTNILLALNNFNEGKPNVIRTAMELAGLFNAHLTVGKFSEKAATSAYKYMAIERAGNSYVRKLQTFSRDLHSSFVHLDGHKFEKNIEKYISKNNIDLVVMLTHKRSFLKSLFNRSMTKRMSYHSRIPVLVIPAKSSSAK